MTGQFMYNNRNGFYGQALHAVGARKHVLVGVGLIGCIPRAISSQGTNESGCVDEQNAAAFIFNDKLKSLVDQFNTKFSADSKYIFINSTAGTLDPSLGKHFSFLIYTSLVIHFISLTRLKCMKQLNICVLL